jgi:hypothetical protein
MEFLSNSKSRNKQTHKKLRQDIVSILNDKVDIYLLENYNSFIPLIHNYYYEIMDYFKERIHDTKYSEKANRKKGIKYSDLNIDDIHDLYSYLREEFNNIFNALDTLQTNLKIIAIQIIKDPKIPDKIDFSNHTSYETEYKSLVDDTISEMVPKFCKWIQLVEVNLNDIHIYSDDDHERKDDDIIIFSFLNKVKNSLNIKNYNKCVQNPRVHSAIRSKPIEGTKTEFPIVTDYQTIPFGSNTYLPVAESHSIQSKLLLPKQLLVRPNNYLRPTPISGGKKSKKKQPRKKSKKNNTRKNK